MTADHRYRHLAGIRATIATVVYPLQRAAHLPVGLYAWMQENLASRSELLKINAQLRRNELLVEAKLEKFRELQAENRRLRRLLDSSTKVDDRVLIAELLSVDMDPFSRRIMLNKGHDDGVTDGQSLIDANGIMGQIVHTSAGTSTALLITDPSHALPAQVNRTGLRCIAVGTGSSDTLELKHIPLNEDVRVGDLIVTSGLGGRFQRGYPVGRIVSVERDSAQSFARVRVKPAAALERNREVLLVWPGEQQRKPPTPSQGARNSNAS